MPEAERKLRVGESRRAGRRRRPVLLLLALAAALSACSDSDTDSNASELGAWSTYGGGIERTFYNANETAITRDTVGDLVPLWRFTTGAVVTASPIVANVEIAGNSVEVVFIASWDGFFYALRAADGTELWNYRLKPHPGASYPQASSATVADVDGQRRVYVGGGMTLYCFDAASGALLWEFDAGTGCTDCDFITERNEILSSPAVYGGLVYFGMDINDFGDGKGGFYALDARDGRLRWYFDLETAATCTPDADDDVRRFDGYHSAAELGLPDDFFATRSGCDFDRTGTACGNVWSSAAIDARRGLLYTASSNCDTDDDPNTPPPPPPMPPYDEALFALDLDTGAPAWRWRPREVDNADLAIGGVPNLFAVEIGGARREVVGIGIKDGTYYLLDRDGVNEITGRIEPYWQTKVVAGGDFGGIISSAAVGEGKVFFGTAIGTDIANPQLPAAWGLDAASGAVRWANEEALPSYSPASAIPGVVFMGSIAGAMFAYDSETGELLARLGVGGPASSPAVIAGGRLFVGAGTGARGGSPANIAFRTSLIPSPVTAFCISGRAGCPVGGSCDDGNSCTSDGRDDEGDCSNTNLPNGEACSIGALPGECSDGFCLLESAICDDENQCTTDTAGPGGCSFEVRPDGTPCVVRDDAGACDDGTCIALE